MASRAARACSLVSYFKKAQPATLNKYKQIHKHIGHEATEKGFHSIDRSLCG